MLLNRLAIGIMLYCICGCFNPKNSDIKSSEDNNTEMNTAIIDEEKNNSKSEKFEIVDILTAEKTIYFQANFYKEFSIKCDDWELTEAQLEEIIKNSVIIDGHVFHYDFSILPCSYEGNVILNDTLNAKYRINAGSTSSIIIEGDTSYFLGYYHTNSYFLESVYRQ